MHILNIWRRTSLHALCDVTCDSQFKLLDLCAFALITIRCGNKLIKSRAVYQSLVEFGQVIKQTVPLALQIMPPPAESVVLIGTSLSQSPQK